MPTRLALKIDVDTERGTRIGVPGLLEDLRAAAVPATFFFSLGPDRTGRAITRIFRPGFLKKVSRTNVLQLYGIRTLLNGVVLPGPIIARCHAAILQAVRDAGFEVGIHCNDHYQWQDHVHRMTESEVEHEFEAARRCFRKVFGREATAAAAPGWQANAVSRRVYDRAGLIYSSDTRGRSPYFPEVNGTVFTTLEIPTTLPTLDELLGRPEYPEQQIASHLISRMQAAPEGRTNVFTLHAEIEGMNKRAIFRELLHQLRANRIEVVSLEQLAREHLAQREIVPVNEMVQQSVDGRSGLLAVQAPELTGWRRRLR